MSTRLQTEVKATSMPTPSFTPLQNGLLQRKRAFGGRPGLAGELAESRGKPLVSQPPLLQAKLTVNQPNDRYEHEADRVADMVMRMPDPLLQSRLEPQEEEERIRPKEAGGQAPQAGHDAEPPINALRGRGQPLGAATRAFFEPRLGYDFSRVRIHADGRAAAAARAVKARAFTLGRDIAFGAGQYGPGTSAGRWLLAHELTHVVQQRQAGVHSQLISREPASPTLRCFGGCSQPHSQFLEDMIPVARNQVGRTAEQLGELYGRRSRLRTPPSVRRPARELPEDVGRTEAAFRQYFGDLAPPNTSNVLGTLRSIGRRLQDDPNNWRCVGEGDRRCHSPGEGREIGAFLDGPVFLCPVFFGADADPSHILIHEAAHQAGLMSVDVYRWQGAFANLGTRDAVRNPDSYAMFVLDTQPRLEIGPAELEETVP